MKPYIDIVDSIKATSMTKFDGLFYCHMFFVENKIFITIFA